ncbi:MAG: hypothetical protein AAFO94_02800 [Bacteroidota bacterium]
MLDEVSGLLYTSDGYFFWLNDSGGAPALYQTNGKGELIKTITIPGVKNRDWEELTSDDKGRIYVGDFGNNRNKRKDLKIFRFDPATEKVDSILFTYPDQKDFPPARAKMNFDMEACFWLNGQLHLFSKNKVGVGDYVTKHYILSDQPGQQVAKLNSQRPLTDRVVTAAAISPDRKTVALLAYDYRLRKPFPYSAASVFLIRNFQGNNFFSGDIYRMKVPKFLVANQYESLDFIDDETIYIATERVKFIRQKAKRLRLKQKHFKRKWKEGSGSF